MEIAYNDKHTSLPHRGIIFDGKMFIVKVGVGQKLLSTPHAFHSGKPSLSQWQML
jgi:hypothetical protein